MPEGSTQLIPNPAYAPAMIKFAEDMKELLPKIQLRMGSATDAAEGLNILYENIRHQRALNFINEVLTRILQKAFIPGNTNHVSRFS